MLLFFQKGPGILNFWEKFLNPHIIPIYWNIDFVLKSVSNPKI